MTCSILGHAQLAEEFSLSCKYSLVGVRLSRIGCSIHRIGNGEFSGYQGGNYKPCEVITDRVNHVIASETKQKAALANPVKSLRTE
jgi:hypothetical protein